MSADLSEFESKLKKQGTMLCLPLGKSLGLALARCGFRQDQEVIVRFGREKLEIRPRSSPEEIRIKLLASAEEIKGLRERMLAYTRDLPAVSDDDLEGEETLEGELLGMLECLVHDDLDPAIEKLESVAALGGGGRGKTGG